MKSVSCSMYILVFLEYSKSIVRSPSGLLATRIVSSSRPARPGDFRTNQGAVMRMRDRTAVVTGAGSGIGRATALRLAAEGARVACADLVAARAESTATAIIDAGGEALALEIDVTDAGACARMIEATQRRFGAVTTLVNSAGIAGSMTAELAPADWRHV